MNGRLLREKMRKGERIYGTLMTSNSPSWLSQVRNIGLDFVFIDSEHTPMDRIQLSWLCQAYKALDIAPMTRIPSPDPFEACMALDAGSNGILAPYIETVEQVEALVGAVRYRPLKGKRLQDVLKGKVQLSRAEREYLENFNAGNFLLVNIESGAAVENLDSLLEVEGLDGIVIGPHDLSINLGIPEGFGTKLFEDTVLLIIRKALEHGKMVGNHYSFGIGPELEWAKAGMNIILHSIDLTAAVTTLRSELNQFREVLGEPPFQAGGKAVL